METIKLDKNLVFRQLEFKTSEEVESYIADQLLNQGYVKQGYKKALLDREKQFPTALPSSPPAIAIPHANADLVNKTTLAVVTLKNPVTFKNMGAVDEDVNVQIVIALVISEPHSQVEVLQKVVGIVQNEKLRKDILNANDNQTLINLVQNVIN
jgi:PTS system galactitol-specific IIA component